MKWDHVIPNGTIVTTQDAYQANIYVKNGKIAAITKEELGGDACEETNADGLYMLPPMLPAIRVVVASMSCTERYFT